MATAATFTFGHRRRAKSEAFNFRISPADLAMQNIVAYFTVIDLGIVHGHQMNGNPVSDEAVTALRTQGRV